MKIKHARVLPVAAATLATAAIGFATTAQAFDFKVSGQVDRAVTAVNNGEKSDIGFVDNNGWNSRFRFTGSQEMDNNTTVGFTYEIGMSNAKSSSWDVNSNGNNDEQYFDTRFMNVWMQGTYGKVAFGKISAASDGTSEVNYSGTAFLGAGVDYQDISAGLTFLDKDGNPVAPLGYIYGGSASEEMDGLGRQNGVVYTTPSLNGFTISTGLYDGHAFDIAPRFETSFGDGGKFAIAADYADSQNLSRAEDPNGKTYNNPRFREYGASTAVLLPSGFNATLVYKHRDYKEDFGYDTDSADNYFASVGYRTGKHNVSVDYGLTKDLLNKGSKFQAIGVGYVYNWTDSIDLYASYHHYMLDDANYLLPNGKSGPVAADGVQDIDQIYAGVRLAFL